MQNKLTRRKIIVIIVSFIVSIALLLSATFAWFSLSGVPEITGIETRIGSNGNLEIALLSDTTYLDPDMISSKVGSSSVVLSATESNCYWGNVIDLSDTSYGLNKISMLPSRLNVTKGDDGRNIVKGNMLTVPTYRSDGRIDSVDSDIVSATYYGNEFTYFTASHSYGVRGIGSIYDMSPQQAALTNARSLVRSYSSAAVRATNSMWQANGEDLFDMVYRYYIFGSDEFTSTDVAVIRDTATRLQGSISYLDTAMRQVVIGHAASVYGGEERFRDIRKSVEDTLVPLSETARDLSLPDEYYEAIRIIEEDKDLMKIAIAECDGLTGSNFTWNQIEPIFNKVLNVYETYLGETKISDMTTLTPIGEDNRLTLRWESGVINHIASFTFNEHENIIFSYTQSSLIEVRHIFQADDEQNVLAEAAENLDELTAANGSFSGGMFELDDVYGYAVDMAFRCNSESQLLLQTNKANRVDGSGETETQGGGSYMRFSSSQLTTEQIVMMMDAIRVGFLDNQNSLIGIAKLNTSNYTNSGTRVTAPLYMYDYKISADGSISIGERLDDEAEIVDLHDGEATIITVVVWLDGDHVDNSLATSTGKSITGSLNLQFASSSELIPSDGMITDGKDE